MWLFLTQNKKDNKPQIMLVTLAANNLPMFRKSPRIAKKSLTNANNPKHFVPIAPDESLVGAPYILHLLPALPTAWSKGKIHGLRARGGFEVDLQWDDNQLTQATIRATSDGSFRIYWDGKLSETISLKQGRSTVWPTTNNK